MRMRRGMTIIEVLLSIGIILVMATVGYSSLGGAIEMNDALQKGDNTTRSARVALARLRRELQLAFLTPNRAAANQYLTVFVGQDDDPDTLWFATLAHQRLYKNSRESDQAEVTVWGDSGPREYGPGDILYHRESRRIDQYPSEGGRIWPLAYNVESFNLRYLDNRTGEWTDEWDSRSADQPYILPRAVQIGLVLLELEDEERDRWIEKPFLTTAVVEYADPVVPLLGEGLTDPTVTP